MSAQRNLVLHAGPDSDIWRKPPSHDVFNAPSTLSTADSINLSSFESTRVTFSAKWTHKFDQAGVLLHVSHTDDAKTGRRPSWIKAGLEYFNSVPQISFVGCDRWADWSVHPARGDPNGEVIVELRREGSALWAYEIVKGAQGEEERYPFRECTWLWDDEAKKTVKVAAYCARPAAGDIGELEVKFGALDVTLEK